MWILIEPLDTLFFRDSHPFAAGETNRARTLFPPLPLTVQGAIRSAVLAEQLPRKGLTFKEYNRKRSVDPSNQSDLLQLREELGGAQGYGKLCLEGPFLLARREEGKTPAVWLPCPLDLLIERETKRPVLLEPGGAFPQGRWNPPLPSKPQFPVPLVAVGHQPEEPEFQYLDAKQLARYLLGDVKWKATGEGELYSREQRLGIQLDRGRRTASTGMLYSSEVIRLRDGDGLLLRVECPHLPSRGMLRLGGEARGARYHKIDADESLAEFRALIEGRRRDELVEVVQETQRFKLYLLTPAIFQEGWLPDFIDRQNLKGELGGVRLRLISAAVGKPMHIGGWNLAINAPRPVYRAVPSGSVYYFEIEEGKAETLFSALHFQSLESSAPRGEELTKIGFGLTLIGGWNYV